MEEKRKKATRLCLNRYKGKLKFPLLTQLVSLLNGT